MQGLLKLTRDQEGFGPVDQRGYIPSSEIVAELRGSDVKLTIKREAVDGLYPRKAELATSYLDRDEQRALALWLLSLPD